jgi:hypothetical protein
MQDTIVPTNQSGLSALVAMVAAADTAGELLVSSNRLVDALLDARSDVEVDIVPLVDQALRACAHRHVVPTDEALGMVATITAALALQADPV